jgi:multidrug efflux pump subunit AcrB
VASQYSSIGGFVFGRSQHERTNLSRIYLQLVPASRRDLSSEAWVAQIREAVAGLRLAGVRVQLRNDGIRGIRQSQGDDDLSLRLQGPHLEELARLADEVVTALRPVTGLENLEHSAEDVVQELAVAIDRERAAALGLNVESVALAVRIALQGVVATDFIEGDQSFDVRVRLPERTMRSPEDVERILLFPDDSGRPAVFLGDVARVELTAAAAEIKRDRQQRIVEVRGTMTGAATLGEIASDIERRLDRVALPAGYTIYDSGAAKNLEQASRQALLLLALAAFLVLVVMAIQYESLRNPVIILLGVLFAPIGVGAAIGYLEMPVSMPVKLGMIMLVGIVVNNAIVLVEYIEIARRRGASLDEAIVTAGRLRLRPILMTTLTTVAGMTPLALGLGEGSELLQPLAITIAWGLTFSVLVSLMLMPALYRILGRKDVLAAPAPAAAPATAGD